MENIININRFNTDIQALSARVLKIKKSKNIKITKDFDVILEVTLNGVTFDIFDTLLIPMELEGKKHNMRYKISKITEEDSFLYAHTDKLNRSYIYILPYLISDIKLHWLFLYLCNCYLKKSEDKYSFILKIRATPTDEFVTLDKYLTSLPLYGFKENLDKAHCYYNFIIPEKYQEDVVKFLSGKYSQLSDVLKKRIITCHLSSPNIKRVKSILYRDNVLKKELESYFNCNLDELESKPKLKYECVI